MLTSDTVNDLNSTGAVLSGSFSQATSVPFSAGFQYGTSESSLNRTVTVSAPSAVEGEFSTTLSGLNEGTTYYYRSFVTVCGTGDYASQTATIYGKTYSFTTATSSGPVGSSNAALGKTKWLEMPAASTITGLNQSSGSSSSCHVEALYEAADESNDANTVRDRNYSYHYDKTTYTSLWVAYPLYNAVMGGSNSASWKKNPSLDEDEQIDIWSGSYGVNVGSTTSADYTEREDYYARGHQIPNADRKNNSSMNSQAYYATNSTPQIQNGFNGGIWSTLENAVRAQASSTDTLYVVTGASFRMVEGSESVTYITPKCDTKSCPLPNYYWKVLLKVKRSGDQITSASAAGFWFEHKIYSGDSYTTYAVSVDQIEAWTGFDFFVNLPDELEVVAEQNCRWETFCSF